MWKNTSSAESSLARSRGSTRLPTSNSQDSPTEASGRSWELEIAELGVGQIGSWELIRVLKLTTYLSFVRFSHSVFALPFALTGALLAWREHPFSWSQVGVDRRLHGERAQRGDGVQPPGRRASRRAQPAHGDARAAARRDDARRGRGLRHRRVRRVRLRRVAAEPALPRAVAGGAGHRLLVFAGEAVHGLHAAVPRAGDGGRAGRRLDRRRRRDRRLEPWLLGLAIGLWVGGFDILYACQDVDVRSRPRAALDSRRASACGRVDSSCRA